MIVNEMTICQFRHSVQVIFEPEIADTLSKYAAKEAETIQKHVQILKCIQNLDRKSTRLNSSHQLVLYNYGKKNNQYTVQCM